MIEDPIKVLIEIAKILDELKIDYYVTGGFAVSIWGKPRFTADIDMVIKLVSYQKGAFADKIQALFPAGYIDKDQIEAALKSVGQFNFIEPGSGLKIDFYIAKQNEFEKECFKKSRTVDLGYKIKLTAPENLILSKLLWYKEAKSDRHLEDIKSVLQVRKNIDQKYLNLWIEELGLKEEWEELKRAVK
jgi:hypothetical protein